jgi:hypothetical protein
MARRRGVVDRARFVLKREPLPLHDAEPGLECAELLAEIVMAERLEFVVRLRQLVDLSR